MTSADQPSVYTIRTSEGNEAKITKQDIICVTTEDGRRTLFHVEPGPTTAELPVLTSTSIDPSSDKTLLAEDYAYNSILDSPSSRITIIISTGSGAKRAAEVAESLLQPLLDIFRISKDQITIHATTSADSIIHLTQDSIFPLAQSGQLQLIVILSGDGGIIDLVNTLYARNPPSATYIKPTIALLPLGTGNALANSTHIARDNTLGLSSLCRGTARPLPTFTVKIPRGSYAVDGNGERVPQDGPATVHGAVVFSWALHSTLVAESDTPAYRAHGAARFRMAATELLYPADGSASHAYKGQLSYRRVGGQDWTVVPRRTHAYVLVTLVSNLEATFCISPDSRPLDGKLRVVHFGTTERGGQAVMEVMQAGYQGGKHVGLEGIGYEEVEALRLEIEEEDAKWRRICVDGKIFVIPIGGVLEVVREDQDMVDLLVHVD